MDEVVGFGVELDGLGVGVGDCGESVMDDGGGKGSILPWGGGEEPTRER